MQTAPGGVNTPAISQGVSRDANLQVYRWVILLVTTGSQMTISLIPQGIGSIASFLAAALALSNTQVGFIGGAVNVGMGIAAVLAGRAVDLWGEKAVLVIGGVCTGVAIMLTSRSNTFPVLLAWLLFTGLWASSATPAGAMAIMTWFPYSERGFALGFRQTGVPLGGLLAALLLPQVAMRFDWRMAMVGMGVVPILGAVVCLMMYRSYPEETIVDRKGPGKTASIRTVFKNINIWLVGFTAITYVAAQFTLVTYLILYFHDRIGLPIGRAALFLALAQLAGAVGRVFWGVVSDRVFRGARKPVMMALGFIIIAISLSMIFLTPRTPVWVMILVAWFFGFSAIGWNGLFVALVSELVGKDQAGTALGLGMTLVQIGVLIFPPIFGFLVDRSGSYQVSWIVLAVLVFCGVIVLGMVREQKGAATNG